MARTLHRSFGTQVGKIAVFLRRNRMLLGLVMLAEIVMMGRLVVMVRGRMMMSSRYMMVRTRLKF